MKWLASTLILLTCLSIESMAQFTGSSNGTVSPLATGAIAGSQINLIPSNASNLQLKYTILGSPATLSVQIETSTNNGSSYSICGAANTSTSGTQVITCIATADHAQVNITTATGGTSPSVVWGLVANNGSLTLGSVSASTSTPADATANASVPGFQAYLMCFNGSTWDRCKGITGQTGLMATGTVNSGANPADGFTQMFTQLNNLGNSQLTSSGVGYVFNNTNYDRVRSGDTANLPNLTGSTLVAPVAIDPCSSSAVVKTSAAINITSATTTQLVAPSGSTQVFVCGFDFTISEVVTTANTLQFTTGTGATCGGSTVTKTGLYGAGGVTAGDPIHIQSASGNGTIFSAAASSGVCAVTAIGGSGSFQGIITFVQR